MIRGEIGLEGCKIQVQKTEYRSGTGSFDDSDDLGDNASGGKYGAADHHAEQRCINAAESGSRLLLSGHIGNGDGHDDTDGNYHHSSRFTVSAFSRGRHGNPDFVDLNFSDFYTDHHAVGDVECFADPGPEREENPVHGQAHGKPK